MLSLIYCVNMKGFVIMVEDNKFNQYGYNHYLKAPARPSDAGAAHSIGTPSSIIRKFQRPLVANIALGIVAVLFIGIVIATYPSGKDEQGNIPIIKADLRPIKSQPVQRGGMSIANSESTIMNVSSAVGGIGEVENLLVKFNNETMALVSKEDALNKAMEQSPMSTIPNADLVEGTLDDEVVASTEKVIAENVLQKIGSSMPEIRNEGDSEFIQKAASAALSNKPKMPKIYAAATAPDTLDFVRKILDEKASSVSSIEPAVGAASPAANVATSSYFVQLASITDRARAPSEWVKMQTRYDVLSGAKYRVQEASLSGKAFYRIQAGPMSKSEAVKLCDDLKAQNKAGGCLVVK